MTRHFPLVLALFVTIPTAFAEPQRIVTKKGDTTVVQVVDEEGWISRETYDAGMCLVKWESPDARKVLLDYDRRLRLARITMPDGSVILISWPDKGRAGGVYRGKNGKVLAKLELNADGTEAEWTDAETGKPAEEPKWGCGIPRLGYFLRKAADAARRDGAYEYDDKGRNTRADEW